MKIVFTGGHHNSALVVARMLKKRGHQLFWLGHKKTMKKEKSISAEYLEVKKHGIPFFELQAGKFSQVFNPWQILKIIRGFFQAFKLLCQLKPDLIVSFGGYLSVPVVYSGFLLNVPSISHEQTSQAGLANRINSLITKRVFITWPSSKKYFPKQKTKLIGLPVREEFLKKKKKASQDYRFNKNLPVIFVIGGKQGCHFLNCLIEEVLEELLEKYNLVHQTGRIEKTNDWPRLRKKRAALSEELKKRYLLKPYFYNQDMTFLLSKADLAVSRAGAHIIYELAMLGKPAILIPFPWANKQEQLKNAQLLQKWRMVKILRQKRTSSRLLKQTINDCLNNLDQ